MGVEHEPPGCLARPDRLVGGKEMYRDQPAKEISRRKRRQHLPLDIESTNTSGWKPLKERLRTTKAAVVCAQEHHSLPEEIAERSQKARKLGWKSFWSPAVRKTDDDGTESTKASAGVAIFIRKFVGAEEVFEGIDDGLEEGRMRSPFPRCWPDGDLLSLFVHG